jgi:hypothetical protein
LVALIRGLFLRLNPFDQWRAAPLQAFGAETDKVKAVPADIDIFVHLPHRGDVGDLPAVETRRSVNLVRVDAIAVEPDTPRLEH